MPPVRNFAPRYQRRKPASLNVPRGNAYGKPNPATARARRNVPTYLGNIQNPNPQAQAFGRGNKPAYGGLDKIGQAINRQAGALGAPAGGGTAIQALHQNLLDQLERGKTTLTARQHAILRRLRGNDTQSAGSGALYGTAKPPQTVQRQAPPGPAPGIGTVPNAQSGTRTISSGEGQRDTRRPIYSRRRRGFRARASTGPSYRGRPLS